MSRRGHVFAGYHAGVIFLYFVGALVFTMSRMNPVTVGLSLVAGSAYAVYLKGLRAFGRTLRGCLPLWLLAAAVNPLVNSLGLTVLFTVGGVPITWEALCYGLTAGGMLASVMIWFSCYQEIMTSDKFLSLFSRLAPVTAMMVAMTLRYIPDTIRRGREISRAQAALQGGEPQGKAGRVRRGLRMASVLMSWSMENAMETADSMKARGYGEGKRSVYRHERMTGRDGWALVLLVGLLAVGLWCVWQPEAEVRFYPFITMPAFSIVGTAAAGTALLFPLILEGKEWWLWRRCQ